MDQATAAVLSLSLACAILAVNYCCCCYLVNRGRNRPPRLTTKREIREQINDHQRCIDALEKLHDRTIQ